MQELIVRSWNGFNIEFELIDGQLMANATAMCAAFKKRPTKWQELDATKAYIAALLEEDAKEAKSPQRTLVEARQGGSNPGTWIVQDLILELAGWLNVPFKVQMHKWVAELLRTGKVELAAPLTPEEFLVQQAHAMLEQSRRLKAIETEQQAARQQLSIVEQKVEEVAAKQSTIDTNYYAVSGYVTKIKRSYSPKEINGFGRRAAALSREQGYTIDHVHDAKYGSVGTYHVDILKQVFDQPLLAVVRAQPPQLRARA